MAYRKICKQHCIHEKDDARNACYGNKKVGSSVVGADLSNESNSSFDAFFGYEDRSNASVHLDGSQS